MSSATEIAKPQRPAWIGKAAGLFIALILVTGGTYFLHRGIAPAREAHFELGRGSDDFASIFFGVSVPDGGGKFVLAGAEARRGGLALMAFGLLFVTWALAMLLTTFPPPAKVRRWSTVLAAWAAANLAAVALLAFPPWKIGAMWSPVAFWGTVTLLGCFLALARTEVWKPWLGRIFVGLCVLGVAGGYLTATIPAGVILAVFATLTGAINAYFLIPSFRAKVQPLVVAAQQRLRIAAAENDRTNGAD